jgi:hypothetical protein
MYVGFQDDWGFRWSRGRSALLNEAASAGATVIRTTVYWSKVARTRPKNPADPFDPAYCLYDLDELIRGAEQRGMHVLLTIWGTPAWANGGAGENRMPRHLSDLRAFAQALAARYSGRYSGFPFVRFYSIWNEPNLSQFLSPQFAPDGQSLAPALYASLFRAAAAGIRSANPSALVAAGETAHRGLDGPARPGFQASHSPARFAELVSQVRPRIVFDAWAHHPYPIQPSRAPEGQGAWPDVSMPQIEEFRSSLEHWFDRPDLPLWITEFGYQTTPGAAVGVTPADQARYLAWAFQAARADPHVQMFLWFVFRDRQDMSWKGGLVGMDGHRKAGFTSFATAARGVDMRNPLAYVRTETPYPLVTVPVTRLGWYDPAGTNVAVWYRVSRAGRTIARGNVAVPLGRDGSVEFRPAFWPAPGSTYRMHVRAEDAHGNVVRSRVTLVPLGEGGPPAWGTQPCLLGDSIASHCP